jgi:hypothetical protein
MREERELQRLERHREFLAFNDWLERFHREKPIRFELFCVGLAVALFSLGWALAAALKEVRL